MPEAQTLPAGSVKNGRKLFTVTFEIKNEHYCSIHPVVSMITVDVFADTKAQAEFLARAVLSAPELYEVNNIEEW